MESSIEVVTLYRCRKCKDTIKYCSHCGGLFSPDYPIECADNIYNEPIHECSICREIPTSYV